MYDDNNKGSLWLADKLTSKGDKCYNGSIKINNVEYKISMFINTSDNPKAPCFRLKVNAPQEQVKANEGTISKKETVADEAFVEFSNEIQLDESEFPF